MTLITLEIQRILRNWCQKQIENQICIFYHKSQYHIVPFIAQFTDYCLSWTMLSGIVSKNLTAMSSIKVAGTTGHPHAKKQNWIPHNIYNIYKN